MAHRPGESAPGYLIPGGVNVDVAYNYELPTLVKVLLDEQAGHVFWDDEHVFDACNEAELELFADSKTYLGTATLTLTAADDIVAFPAGVMIPQYLLGTSGKYFPTTHAKLEQYDREWKGEEQAYPKAFVVWDASHFRVFPKPDATYEFTVWGVPWPDEVTAATPDPALPRELKLAVALVAAANLLEFTNPVTADAFSQQAELLIRRYKRRLYNAGGHNLRRFRPGTAFTVAQAGVVELIQDHT